MAAKRRRGQHRIKVKLDAERVHLNSGGYDRGGRYYGVGQKLYRISGDGVDMVVRAKDAKAARASVEAIVAKQAAHYRQSDYT